MSDKPKVSTKKCEKPVDDFPSLHSMSTSVQQQQPKPPPGFRAEPAPPTTCRDSPSTTSKPSSSVVPPGFSNQTSTTSTTAAPQLDLTNCRYSEPPNFRDRNLQLIQDIRSALATIEDGFSNFKALSGQFRSNSLAASDYYLSCQIIMGKWDFVRIFPELLALLPDIRLQGELFEMHQYNSDPEAHRQATLWCCPVCGQVCLEQDRAHHQQTHGMEAADYPSLGGRESRPVKAGLKGSWIKA